MAKPRWWVCPVCSSVNDVPARKCYKCRSGKPADPTLLDDRYDEVAAPRVGIKVDVARIAELVSHDPLETQKSSGLPDEDVLGIRPVASAAARAAPPPMREPIKRSITEAGGVDWREGLPPLPDPVPAATPPSGGPAPGRPAAPPMSAAPPAPGMPAAPLGPRPPAPPPPSGPGSAGAPGPAAPTEHQGRDDSTG
jgi:hypothetical protein